MDRYAEIVFHGDWSDRISNYVKRSNDESMQRYRHSKGLKKERLSNKERNLFTPRKVSTHYWHVMAVLLFQKWLFLTFHGIHCMGKRSCFNTKLQIEWSFVIEGREAIFSQKCRNSMSHVLLQHLMLFFLVQLKSEKKNWSRSSKN